MNGSKKGASYAKAFPYAYNTINYVNLGTNPCVLKWFNSQYPAIIPGNKPIPPPPKPTPDDHDDDADDHDEHPNPHDDDDNPHPKPRPSGYDEDDSDDNAVTLILASLAFIL
ncbi:MAG: hypothetical protein V2I33_16395 [Kangiellaceae bacterium]|nr:hypothetical protein [Kangiellaceae bacterium]